MHNTEPRKERRDRREDFAMPSAITCWQCSSTVPPNTLICGFLFKNPDCTVRMLGVTCNKGLSNTKIFQDKYIWVKHEESCRKWHPFMPGGKASIYSQPSISVSWLLFKNIQRLHRVNWYFKKLLLSPAVFQAKAKLGFNCQRKKTQSRSWTGQAWRVKNYCTTACQNRKENQERDHLKICVTFRWQQVLEISGAPLQAAAGLHSTFISIRSACVILRCL